jgi:hypothetical protein
MPAPFVALIFAHQGGWDEMLLVAAPIALLAGVLWLANRRAGRLQDARGEHTPDGDPADVPTGDEPRSASDP